MSYQYDVVISFAGEDRIVAEKIAGELTKLNVRVFYDEFEKASLWGKDIYQHFQKIYRDVSRYCLIIISENYKNKVWAKHELKQAQARALREDEYILPVRLDNTEIPGFNETISYVDFRTTDEKEIANLIIKKLCSSLTVWKLFDFLRNTNPHIVHILKDKQKRLSLLVSSSRAYLINELLHENDLSDYAHITPTHNFIMNGVGMRGCILDKAGQPWESYIFDLTPTFFNALRL